MQCAWTSSWLPLLLLLLLRLLLLLLLLLRLLLLLLRLPPPLLLLLLLLRLLLLLLRLDLLLLHRPAIQDSPCTQQAAPIKVCLHPVAQLPASLLRLIHTTLKLPPDSPDALVK